MSNYRELYYMLFAGMSNLVEGPRPATAEGQALRRTMIDLLRRCETAYLEQE